MQIQEIRETFKDDVISAMDSLLYGSTFSFEPLSSMNEEKQLSVLEAARELYMKRDHIKICEICHHSELIVDEWMSSRLCVLCYNKRSNRRRAEDILKGN